MNANPFACFGNIRNTNFMTGITARMASSRILLRKILRRPHGIRKAYTLRNRLFVLGS
jgi:hypothetical protein